MHIKHLVSAALLTVGVLWSSLSPAGYGAQWQGQANFCNLNGPVGPLRGNTQDQVQDIRAQIDWGRREIDADRAATDEGRRYAHDNWQSEQARLAFEHRRECFEHWRENMENIRSNIESRPYY
jgi:hypothetical protein